MRSNSRDGRLRGATCRLLIASNRLPPDDENAAAGGLVSALRDALPQDSLSKNSPSQNPTLWFGCGSKRSEGGPTSIAARDAPTRMPITLPAVTHDRFYRGFCNSVLWPICHGMSQRVRRTPGDSAAYWRVNRLFADAIHKHLRSGDGLWVHDYHLLPLARCLRELDVEQPIGFFFHVPVPSRAELQQAPDCIAVFAALESCDVIGVQTVADASRLRGYSFEPRIVVAPVGIDTKKIRMAAVTAEEAVSAPVQQDGCRLLVGVDRLDYTKGLIQRLLGFDTLLRNYPNYRGKVALLQVVAPSRAGAAGYRRLQQEVRTLAERINRRWGTRVWRPLHLREEALPRAQVAALLRRAEVAIVTPARDGMNLVAKEFVAAQDPDNPGVLILSRQAGAADALVRARLVDADEPEEISAAIDIALRSPLERRRRDHQSLLSAVRRESAAGWHATLASALASHGMDNSAVTRARFSVGSENARDPLR